MILKNIDIVDRKGKFDIAITGNMISSIDHTSRDQNRGIEIMNAIAYPGFINSHDHLDFNLFPALGNRIYADYAEWGIDIHQTNKQIIEEVQRVPESLRVEWGIYKNLLNGFTTVVNHGKYLELKDTVIDVFQDCFCLHSPAFEKNWKWKLSNPYRNKLPFVMHLGEGTSQRSADEIGKVIRHNYLKRKIIPVHGVAMQPEDARHFKGLIWCPASNRFLLDRTAAIAALEGKIPIVLGTDSTLTAPWNLADHLKIAFEELGGSAEKIFRMLTTEPAELWGMDDKGTIAVGKRADIIVMRLENANDWNEFEQFNPEKILIVIKDGMIRLFDESVKEEIKGSINPEDLFTGIRIGDSVKYVYGNLKQLEKNIKDHYSRAQFPGIIA